MSGKSTKLLKLFESSIELKELIVRDDSNDDVNQIPDLSKALGDLFPLIQINGKKFKKGYIEKLEIHEDGFIPTVSAIISDKGGILSNSAFPTSGCIMSVYIASRHKKLKAIRADFLITSIESSKNSFSIGDLSGNGIGFTFYIEGTLYVPELFNSIVKSYKGTSLDVLKSVAESIKCGFVTNEESTNDEMTWIQANERCDTFIDEISGRMFKDDDSFYNVFIDKYYNLNVVNYGNMVSKNAEDEVESFTYDSITNLNHINSKWRLDTNDEKPTMNFLTNISMNKGNASYVKTFTIETTQGDKLLYEPVNKRIFYYDIQQSNNNSEKFVDTEIVPKTTIESDETIYNNAIYTWEGIETGNVHDNYIFSKSHNDLCFSELRKNIATVTTDGVNLNIIRGMRIPVFIFKQGDIAFDSEINSSQEEENKNKSRRKTQGFAVDERNSAYYVVDTLSIIYEKNPSDYISNFHTEMKLLRSDWPENYDFSTNEDDIAIKENKINRANKKAEKNTNISAYDTEGISGSSSAVETSAVSANSEINNTLDEYYKKLSSNGKSKGKFLLSDENWQVYANIAKNKYGKYAGEAYIKNATQLMANLDKLKPLLNAKGYDFSINVVSGGKHATWNHGNATHDSGAKADLSLFKKGKKLSFGNIMPEDLATVLESVKSVGLNMQMESNWSNSSGWIDVQLSEFWSLDDCKKKKDTQFPGKEKFVGHGIYLASKQYKNIRVEAGTKIVDRKGGKKEVVKR